MIELTPRKPYRPLSWTDAVLDVQEVLAAVDVPVYIVGGGVRDALMGLPIKDIDLATPGNSLQLARKVANAMPNGALFVMDEERGVARAILDTMHGPLNVDVARFRSDEGNLFADLQDRDFTINAIAVDLHSDMTEIIDPLNGERDLIDKQVRQCTPRSISDDPIRALRAIRQSTQLRFRVEKETLVAVRAATDKLDRVSPERVRDEFIKVLSLERPAAALRVFNVIGLLDAVLPAQFIGDKSKRDDLFATMDKLSVLLQLILLSRTDNLATDFSFGVAVTQLAHLRKSLEAYLTKSWPNERPHRALLMLMVLVQWVDPEDVDELIERLKLSNAESKWLQTALHGQRWVYEMPDVEPLNLHRYWYLLGEAGIDVALFTLVNHLALKGVLLKQDEWLQLVERVRFLIEAYYLHHDTLVQPPTLVDGRDLMEQLGLKPGKQIGQLLDAIREAQVMGKVHTSDEALAFARDVINE